MVRKKTTKSKSENLTVFRSSVGFNAILFLEVTLILFPLIILLPNISEISADPFSYIKDKVYELPIFLIYSAAGMAIVTYVYPVEVTSNGIRSYTIWGIKTDCLWEDMATVKIKSFNLFSKFIYVQNNENKNLIVLPYKGLFKYEQFKEACFENAPINNVLCRFLKKHG